jgi:lipoprotein-anchoring transpeptidase ErfK/SrfK
MTGRHGLAVAVSLLSIGIGAQVARASGTARIAPQQQIVTLFTAHTALNKPGANGTRVALVRARRPITGERTVLPVLAQSLDHGRSWLRVRLPGRTLGNTPPPLTGWISTSNARLSTTPWHILVDLGARKVTVYHNGRALHRYSAVVGAPATPTPTGEFFVEENVQLLAGDPGGPYALATSDRSRVFQEFDGGPGQIAIHGLDNLGGTLGTAQSHGCIRLADSAITWLAVRIPGGVPITIR